MVDEETDSQHKIYDKKYYKNDLGMKHHKTMHSKTYKMIAPDSSRSKE